MWRAAVLITLVAVAPAHAQGFRWWRDVGVQEKLRLSDIQVTALEQEYNRTLEERRALRRQVDAADAEVHAALAQGDITDAAMSMLVDRAEDLRVQRNVARTMLLVRLYHLLTPEQRTSLTSLQLPEPGRPPR